MVLPRASQKAPWPPSFYGNFPHEAHLLHKLSLLFRRVHGHPAAQNASLSTNRFNQNPAVYYPLLILRRVLAVIVDPDPTLHVLAFSEAKIHDFR